MPDAQGQGRRGYAITIVTVVYNDLAGLRKTYESVCSQSNRDFRWVVVDGGSTDGAADYLLSLDCPFLDWSSEADEGIYDAMNRGVSRSAGEYVVFMNAGDVFFDSDVLAKVGMCLSGCQSGADILYGGAMLSFPGSGRKVYRAPRRAEKSLWHGLPANHQATFYRRALLGMEPYDLQYQLCGDYYLSASLIRDGARAVYLDEPLATFEVGGLSYTRRTRLFAEPYCIQRDVLGLPWYYRLASMCKRFISMMGFVLLSQSIFAKRVGDGHSCRDR